MKKLVNLVDSLYSGEYVVSKKEKLTIPLRKLVELSLKHNLTDAHVEINFYDDYYNGLEFESVNFVGESDEKGS